MTPMMKQYYEMKNQTEGSVLFFRLGDFYEMFDDDARLVSKELDLTLTTRDRSAPPEQQTPMCGIPYHSSEAYIARLLAKGLNVAVCEQLGDPALAKGLVERKVVRYLTPGTVTESTCLDEGRNNYLLALAVGQHNAGLCFTDVSAGQIHAASLSLSSGLPALRGELARFAPREVIVPRGAALFHGVEQLLTMPVSRTDDDSWQIENAGALVAKTFGSLPVCAPEVICAVGAALAYLNKTQQQLHGLLGQLQIYSPEQFLNLDAVSRRHLEITESLSGDRKNTLLSVVDRTVTPMGRRLLRNWLECPLRNRIAIDERLDGVQALFDDAVLRGELTELLKPIGDLERLTARCAAGTASARDVAVLGCCCQNAAALRDGAAEAKGVLPKRAVGQMDDLRDIAATIESLLAENPPAKHNEGGLIRPGADSEVDRLRGIVENTKGLVAAMESSEREKTGIKTLKIGYNRVFGYYIEISKSQTNRAPEGYNRKQTLANCERYITPELREMESTILTARDRLFALEESLFLDLRARVAAAAARIRATAQGIAILDALTSLAAVAAARRYVRPCFDHGDVIDIADGRHPVVEASLKDSAFVPNDTHLDRSKAALAVITGPNMAGKSTYMRQTALIVLLAQAGSFVPAKSARIGEVDAIFTRIGASDDLAGGRSTFMVEMSEVSHILTHATSKSLLILDEIGRGTSTFDGMAVAQAVLEYVVQKVGARALFATHYHELTGLEGRMPNVVNYNITAKKRGGDVVFLRKVVRGGADDSFGVEVAKLAGLPAPVVKRAGEILHTLEAGQSSAPSAKPSADPPQLSMSELSGHKLAEELADLPLETLTPIEAMNTLFALRGKAQELCR